MFKIAKRPVDAIEASLFIEKIKLTPNIIGYTLSEWMSAKHTFVAEDRQGEILGVCMSYDISESCTKIAALYVLEKFRNQGISKELLNQSCKDAISRQKDLYTISCNPIVIDIMQELNFMTFANLLHLPSAHLSKRLLLYAHSLQWLSHPYRIKEIIRKQRIYPSRKPFIYGLKSYF